MTMSKHAVQSCPFCGSTNLTLVPVDFEKGDELEWFGGVTCLDCRAAGPRKREASMEAVVSAAIEAWNNWEATERSVVHMQMSDRALVIAEPWKKEE